jgi:hypothetical protein
VAERLRHATAEGRLTADELEERLEALYAARTYGELDTLVSDLPVRSSPGAGSIGMPRWIGVAAAVTLLLTVFGLLARAARHATEVVGPPRIVRGLAGPGPLAESHHVMVAAASLVIVLAVFAVSATVLWRFMRSRNASAA